MAILYTFKCDVIGCEGHGQSPNGHTPPAGWRTVTTYVKTTADISPYAKMMNPVISQIADSEDDPEKAKKNKRLTEAAMAAFGESLGPTALHAHICDRHELPAVDARPCQAPFLAA